MCGKDSDGDGYPDMELNCNDSHCVQVIMYICIYIFHDLHKACTYDVYITNFVVIAISM